jgi:predicted SPOUT superfamily RNA methylase MTH1
MQILEKVEELKNRFSETTISIAVPASIILNSQSPELQTYLVSQIARAASIFRIDEIIVINDCTSSREADKLKQKHGDATEFFVKNLQYLETPQYLRKTLFPVTPELRYTGLMNPLDAPHHLRKDEWSKFREGVVINRPNKPGKGSWVNIGLKIDCQIDINLQHGTRVTIQIDDPQVENPKFYTGHVVSQMAPKVELGVYWGYTVRVAENLKDVFEYCPYTNEKYDLLIGTSDKGDSYQETKIAEKQTYKHALIVFGGLPGIEGIIESDESNSIKVSDTRSLFNYYLNTCLNQGCRTIRTEVIY